MKRSTEGKKVDDIECKPLMVESNGGSNGHHYEEKKKATTTPRNNNNNRRCFSNLFLVVVIFMSILLLESISKSETNWNPFAAKEEGGGKIIRHTENRKKKNKKETNQKVHQVEKKKKKQKKLPPWKRDTCKSLYKTKGNKKYELEDRQHSPLIFERDNVMVCRTPKVGSAELRCLQRSYELKQDFEMLKNANCRPVERDILSELHDLEDPRQHNHWLYSKQVKRIMFVRHPVKRILSGFIQVAKTKTEDFWQSYGFSEQGYGPEAFRTFLFNSSFIYEHDPVCSKASTYFSLESWSQHWAPPQHCRCGIWDCDVDWTVYKVEEQSIGTVMGKYVPGPWVPDDADREKNYHSKSYDEKKYLTPDVLKFLNDLTKIEQDFFGYKPYVIPGTENDKKKKKRKKRNGYPH